MNTYFYLQRIQEEFRVRKHRNPGYSIRAFARDLGIDSSNLSAILNKKRSIPKNRIEEFCQKLQLSPKEKMLFVSSIYRNQRQQKSLLSIKNETQYLQEEMHFRVIAEWEYYAFLNLIEVDGFQSDENWICNRLNITRSRLKTIIETLSGLHLISVQAGKFVRTSKKLKTTEDVESVALKKAHTEELNLAKEKMNNVGVDQRDYSSMTIAIDSNLLPELKALIRDFYDRFEELTNQGKGKDEVYQINCQLFPLTNGRNNQK